MVVIVAPCVGLRAWSPFGALPSRSIRMGVDVGEGSPLPQELSLTVSSPALLLNHMAERYSSTSRILMEFVDNSLDDA